MRLSAIKSDQEPTEMVVRAEDLLSGDQVRLANGCEMWVASASKSAIYPGLTTFNGFNGAPIYLPNRHHLLIKRFS